MADTRAELAAALGALRGSIIAVGRPRRAPGGQWFVRVRAHRPLASHAPPPLEVPAVRVPRALVAAIAVGGLAAAVLLVLATSWAVHHGAAILGAGIVLLVLVIAAKGMTTKH